MHRLLTGACLMSPKQMVPYYPVCVYGAQDPPLQLSALAGPPQPPEQVPSYPELGCLTQQARPPIENVLPYTQREMVNLGYPYAGIFMPSYPLKHQTANILASPTDNVVPLELLEEEINPDLLKEP